MSNDSSGDDLHSVDPRAKARMENRDYVWKYWAFHAEQRLKTFNFFILYTTVLIAGSLAYIKDAPHPYFVAPCGLLLMTICWLFWRLDCRNRELIRHSEGILKCIELDISPEIVPESQRLMCVEEIETDRRRKVTGKLSWRSPLSFYDVFCINFVLFAILGALLFVVSIMLPSKQSAHEVDNVPSMPIQNFYLAPQTVPLTKTPNLTPIENINPSVPAPNIAPIGGEQSHALEPAAGPVSNSKSSAPAQ